MYIIDKKRKDYYDGVVGTMGVDRSIIYNRTLQEIDNVNKFPTEFISNRHGDKNPIVNLNSFGMVNGSPYHNYSTFIVGFCGKLYIGWKLYFKYKRKYEVNEEVLFHIYYDFETVKCFISTSGWKRKLVDYVNEINSYNAMHIFQNV